MYGESYYCNTNIVACTFPIPTAKANKNSDTAKQSVNIRFGKRTSFCFRCGFVLPSLCLRSESAHRDYRMMGLETDLQRIYNGPTTDLPISLRFPTRKSDKKIPTLPNIIRNRQFESVGMILRYQNRAIYFLSPTIRNFFQ